MLAVKVKAFERSFYLARKGVALAVVNDGVTLTALITVERYNIYPPARGITGMRIPCH